MITGSAVDWTTVIDTLIGVLPATLAAYFAYRVRRDIRTPSGDSIGTQVEQANHLAAANVGLSQNIHKIVSNGHTDTTEVAPDAGAA